MPEQRNLRYLQAEHVESDGISLCGMPVEAGGGDVLGNVDGVIVEPGARRACYFVVAADNSRRYLVPMEPVRLDATHQAVQIVGEPEPEEWAEFDPRAFDEFDDADLMAALFSRTARR